MALRGDPTRAVSLYDEALTNLRPVGIQHHIALALNFRGEALREVGDLAGAAASFREGLTLGRAFDDHYSIASGLEGLGVVAAAQGQPERAALGESEFAAAWAAGHALTRERAIAEALGESV